MSKRTGPLNMDVIGLLKEKTAENLAECIDTALTLLFGNDPLDFKLRFILASTDSEPKVKKACNHLRSMGYMNIGIYWQKSLVKNSSISEIESIINGQIEIEPQLRNAFTEQ